MVRVNLFETWFFLEKRIEDPHVRVLRGPFRTMAEMKRKSESARVTGLPLAEALATGWVVKVMTQTGELQ